MFINTTYSQNLYPVIKLLVSKKLKLNGNPSKLKSTYSGSGAVCFHELGDTDLHENHKYFKYKNLIIWQNYHGVDIIEINERKPNKFIEGLKKWLNLKI